MLLDLPHEIDAQHVWVAEDAHNIVGAGVWCETDLCVYIDTVAVMPVSQGRVVGRALLALMQALAARQY